jgi:hypothetical protein
MVAAWIVLLTLIAVCGLAALAIVNIINCLDRTPSIGGDAEPESRLSDDDQYQPTPRRRGDRPRLDQRE